MLIVLNQVLVEQFIAGQEAPPQERILDVDASDIPLHGEQEGSPFHGYYDHYCYLPLYVYCGKALLACVLRNSRIDGAKPTVDHQTPGQAPAASLARCTNHRAGRFGVLPPATDSRV
jgi:hypothetical protein